MTDLGPEEDLTPEIDRAGDLVRAAPGLARIAAAAWWEAARWTVRGAARTGSRAVRAAASGTSPAELFQSTGKDARDYARRMLGIAGVPKTDPGRSQAASPLRARGAELLRRSADVHFKEDTHPAYERILGDLAPDEARILRLLAIDGPQAAVDVRTSRPLNIGSELVAPGLSMIGAEAGARHPDRVPRYLNNLFRLGLIWFSREPVKERDSYQVLEAQPDVLEAMRRAGRAKTVRRSIHLTPFGHDFCMICLAIDPTAFDSDKNDLDAQEGRPAEEPEE
jgi:abortive infection alpha-like protein